jgi:UDP-glucose 4-epimerase
MANILVTGGAGFLGSHIADALSDAGYSVTVLDLHASQYIRADQQMVCGSILEADFLDSVFTRGEFSAVYHLAALADLNEAKSKPKETVIINILGTVNLLEQCVKHSVPRFIFGSSVYVYSQHGGFYRCSKQACENYIEEFKLKYGLDFTILRFGSLYGTRTNETNGVYRLLHKVMNEEVIHYHGSEEDKREYIHVQDAAKLSVQALEPQYANKHLTLTGNDRLSISDLFKMFGEILNKEVKVQYEKKAGANSGHYSITPYAFTPKLGKKLVTHEYVDMGQGLIEVMQMIYNEQEHKSKNG